MTTASRQGSMSDSATARTRSPQMSTHMASPTVTAEPAHLLRVLTDPAACGRWAPIAFSTDQAPGERLQAGTRTTLRGRIAGRNVTFETHVVAANERGPSLR